MKTRLISQADVEAMLDARITKVDALIGNGYASASEKRLLASTLSVLKSVRDELNALPCVGWSN